MNDDPRFKQLQEQIDLLQKQMRQLTTLTYRAEVSGGIVSYAYADLPTPNITGRKAFVTNGRKSGEGAGTGTGVEAVVAMLGGTLQWVMSSDNSTAVTV